jgi:diphosphomevalonate decarboxylase
MSNSALCLASPSLALLKYWGKRDVARNIPATTSVAVTLAGLTSATHVRVLGPREGEDRVTVNGTQQPAARFEKFFSAFRQALETDVFFEVESTNNFPTSAGLASSSSGFAALALACNAATAAALSDRELSALARIGSASAARAVFGGFSILPAGAVAARQLFNESHWPELRVIVCVVEEGAKKTTSRGAMERSRLTSPYFRAWRRSSARAVPGVLRALKSRDIEQLGEAMRLSYLRMFATIVSTDPPTLYWLPQSVAILNECRAMRESGLGVWETMDAGPQVKLICLADIAERVRERIEDLGVTSQTIECAVGGPPRVEVGG